MTKGNGRETVVGNKIVRAEKAASSGLHVVWDVLLAGRVELSWCEASCRIRSDRQTTSLTLTTGVCEAGTKMRGASNMNIHYDVTGLLTAAWRSHSGQIVWAA